MGSWGFSPLQNDAALDWLQQLFDESGLGSSIEASLNLNLHEYPDEIRVAAAFVNQLTSAGLWPHHSRAQFIELAILRLQQLLADKVFINANFVAEIRNELRGLAKQLQPPTQPTTGPSL